MDREVDTEQSAGDHDREAEERPGEHDDVGQEHRADRADSRGKQNETEQRFRDARRRKRTARHDQTGVVGGGQEVEERQQDRQAPDHW